MDVTDFNGVFAIEWDGDATPFVYRRDYQQHGGDVHMSVTPTDIADGEYTRRHCEFRENDACLCYHISWEEANARRIFKDTVRPHMESGQPSTTHTPPRQYLQEMWGKA